VAALAARMTAARPGLPYLCDPVLGDEGPGLYLPVETGEIIRRDLIPRASIATPNAFELGWLTGHAPRTIAETRAAALALIATGPARVFVTGLSAGLPAGETGILAVEAGAAALVRTPRLPHRAEGAGDLAAALILAHQLAGRGIAETAALTAASLLAVLEATLSAGQRELAIVAAQDALADPPDRFTATPL
jgi:pyridoxine kinase